MFCQICGAKLRSTAHFCNQCGKPVQERFGSALLATQKAATHELKPGQTAEQEASLGPTTPELTPKPRTDQIAQRGTERQPPAKSTAGEAEAALEKGTDFMGTPPGAITNVSARLGAQSANETVPDDSPKQSYGVISYAVTQVEEDTLSETPPAVDLSTLELQRGVTGKPFFTQWFMPSAPPEHNQQHRRLARAVPIVLLALVILLVFAYWASK
ncbi:MAG: zinc ribbon domain-containing protein [Acidobacteria bacterium]|nr:zinc ribbon domain-containing protein [Acidobacteriota bacterium]MBI3427800.1 zinc ribbon domain-containing protein [Acidobacteriota bacterium]